MTSGLDKKNHLLYTFSNGNSLLSDNHIECIYMYLPPMIPVSFSNTDDETLGSHKTSVNFRVTSGFSSVWGGDPWTACGPILEDKRTATRNAAWGTVAKGNAVHHLQDSSDESDSLNGLFVRWKPQSFENSQHFAYPKMWTDCFDLTRKKHVGP